MAADVSLGTYDLSVCVSIFQLGGLSHNLQHVLLAFCERTNNITSHRRIYGCSLGPGPLAHQDPFEFPYILSGYMFRHSVCSHLGQ